MKHWPTICLCAILAAGLGRFATAAPADSLPKPIWFPQLAFSIPFNIAEGLPPAQQPSQVQLYVSNDRGASWRLAQSVSPQSKKFDFRAPIEAEYCFLIRTVDRQGRVTPAPEGPPELRVIVDTTPPTLDLSAARAASGEVRLRWNASDPLLNPDSLKVEYQLSSGTWREIGIDHDETVADDTKSTGSFTWWPTDAPAAPGVITVRAEIRDRAGNPTRVQARTQVAAGESLAPRPNGDLVTGSPGRVPVGQAPRRVEPENASFANRPRVVQPSPSTEGNPPYMAREPDGWPARRNPLAESPSRDYDHAIVSTVNPPLRNQVAPRSNENSVGDPSAPPTDRSASDHSPALPRDAASDSFRAPQGQNARMVNSKSFELDYEIESIGPSGIAKVELWGTRDEGRTWTSYGIDNDNRSPMRVNVEGEGLYGFRITVQSGSGLASPTPRGGDAPELWIAVDLVAPQVQLVDVQSGAGEQAGQLLIRWDARDKALADRPISLMFASQPGGPWNMIAANLENNGQYAWRPDNRASDQVYLRLEARDEAGNIGVFEAADPTPLDRVRPEGRIRGVRPVTNTAGRVQVYEFYR